MEAIEAGLGRLEGAKSAKVGEKKSQYIVRVLENKAVTPSQVKGAVPEGYKFNALSIEIVGTVAKDGDAYSFTARGSRQKFSLVANDELRRLVDGGKSTLVVSGKVTEKDKSTVIEVSSAKELTK